MPALSIPIPRRIQTIQTFKDRGGQVAAVLPIHYPRALLRAFDILPVEVWGPPGADISYGAAHLQPYVCSIVRNALSYLLAGGLEVVDYILVPHACDSLQGLGSILLDFIHRRQPVFPLYVPRGRRESDLDFFASEIQLLYERLEEITGRSPGGARLVECVRREEEADRLLTELHGQRRHLSLAQIDFYRLVRAREYLPSESFTEIAQRALVQATEGLHENDASSHGIPILLSGIVPEPMSLFEALAEMGGRVVADDLACCGRRLYPPGADGDVFHRMAAMILAAPPDAMHGAPISDRLTYLLRLIEDSGAEGVVFYGVKFCEPELFDLPSLRDGLDVAGVRSLVIEVDINDGLSHQTLNRLEAFLETIA